MTAYYWLSFAVTLWAALRVPTKMRTADNIIASVFVAAFGFVIWPLAVRAAIKTWPKP